MSTFVSIGTSALPFGRFFLELDRLAPKLPCPVVVQHGHTPFAFNHCIAMPFVDRDTFDRYLVTSRLVITHGGATVLQAIRSGRTPVVIPRSPAYGEIIDDHQIEFARALASAGRVFTAYEPAELERVIDRALAVPIGARAADNSRMVALIASSLYRYAQEHRR